MEPGDTRVEQARALAEQEVHTSQCRRLRKDIEGLLLRALRDAHLPRKEFDYKMRLVAESLGLISQSLRGVTEAGFELETKLGLSIKELLDPLPAAPDPADPVTFLK
jgi:hypothetical protein